MIISIAQIILSVIVIMLILLQERSSGLSGLFGGTEGGIYQVRRGMERIIFFATIALIIVLMALSLAGLYYHK